MRPPPRPPPPPRQQPAAGAPPPPPHACSLSVCLCAWFGRHQGAAGALGVPPGLAGSSACPRARALPAAAHHSLHPPPTHPPPPLPGTPVAQGTGDDIVSDQWLPPFVIVDGEGKPVGTIEDGARLGWAGGWACLLACLLHGLAAVKSSPPIRRSRPPTPSPPTPPSHPPTPPPHPPTHPFPPNPPPTTTSTPPAGDAVVIFNFRADRVIEISKAFEYEQFTAFDRVRWPKARVVHLAAAGSCAASMGSRPCVRAFLSGARATPRSHHSPPTHPPRTPHAPPTHPPRTPQPHADPVCRYHAVRWRP